MWAVKNKAKTTEQAKIYRQKRKRDFEEELFAFFVLFKKIHK